MKEGNVADEYRMKEEDEAASGGFTASTAFPALVALWFAALFGGGCLFLPPVLFDTLFGGAAPFGPNTRIVFALGAAGIGLVMGLFIASRVRGTPDEREEQAPAAPRKPKRKRKSKRDARKPLDVRAALGLDSDYDDDDDEIDEAEPEEPKEDEFELAEEAIADDEPGLARPPIDDPYFASAWSDSDTYDQPDAEDDEPENTDWSAAPLPRPEAFQERASNVDDWELDAAPQPSRPSPSRYNPFANFVTGDDAPEDDLGANDDEAEPYRFDQSAHRFAEEPAPRQTAYRAPTPDPFPEPEPKRPTAPPPPPAWPMPRAEEPQLKDLGVAELVERLARALQGQGEPDLHERPEHASRASAPIAPPRSGGHRHDSALAPRTSQESDVDLALRGALDRLVRLDDVA